MKKKRVRGRKASDQINLSKANLSNQPSRAETVHINCNEWGNLNEMTNSQSLGMRSA